MTTTLGSIVYVRYLDHTLFKNVNPHAYTKSFMPETMGWLDYEDDKCIRLVWERFIEPKLCGEARPRATGLVILKTDILEIKTIEEYIYKVKQGLT